MIAGISFRILPGMFDILLYLTITLFPAFFISAILASCFHKKISRLIPKFKKQQIEYESLKKNMISIIENPQFQYSTLLNVETTKEKILLRTDAETEKAKANIDEYYKEMQHGFIKGRYNDIMILLFDWYNENAYYKRIMENMDEVTSFNVMYDKYKQTKQDKSLHANTMEITNNSISYKEIL